jgi:hypothetical protein
VVSTPFGFTVPVSVADVEPTLVGVPVVTLGAVVVFARSTTTPPCWDAPPPPAELEAPPVTVVADAGGQPSCSSLASWEFAAASAAESVATNAFAATKVPELVTSARRFAQASAAASCCTRAAALDADSSAWVRAADGVPEGSDTVVDAANPKVALT